MSMHLSAPIDPTPRRSLPTTFPWKSRPAGLVFFNFDPNALYSIYIDNTGDGEADVTFDFKFKTTIANPNTFLAHLGTAGPGGGDAVIGSLNDPDFNVKQTYSVSMTSGSIRLPFGLLRGRPKFSRESCRPPYNIGPGATPAIRASPPRRSTTCPAASRYLPVSATIRSLSISAQCSIGLELRPLGLFRDPRGKDSLQASTCIRIALQVPISMLTADGQKPTNPTAKNAVVGIWAAASRPMISILRTMAVWTRTGRWSRCRGLGIRWSMSCSVPCRIAIAGMPRILRTDIQYRQNQVVAPGSSRARRSSLRHEHAVEWRRCSSSEAFPDDESHRSRVDSVQGHTGEWNHGTQFHDRHRRRPE